MMRAALVGLALGLLIGAGGAWQAYRHGVEVADGRHAAALAQAQADNIAKQKALILGVQKVSEDADTEQLELERRLASADQSVERLRHAIRDANASAGSAATAVADATSARALLADCAGRYRDLAKHADKLRANVLGLQAYARVVSAPQ